MCYPCSVGNCSICSGPDTCDECHHYAYIDSDTDNGAPERTIELMLSPDSTLCQPKIDNCKAPKSHQPQGLAANYEKSPAEWYCNECEYGFFADFDDNSDTFQTCVRCKDRVSDCRTCEYDLDEGLRCLSCEYGLIPNVVTCEAEKIPNCAVVSEKSDEICEKCHWSFGKSPDGRKCIPCSMLSKGCIQCTLDQFGVPSTCLKCAENLSDPPPADNICVFDNCDVWTNEDDMFNQISVASCSDCSSKYGLQEYEDDHFICAACSSTGNWNKCTDCSVDSEGVAIDCTDCFINSTEIYLLNEQSSQAPAHQC